DNPRAGGRAHERVHGRRSGSRDPRPSDAVGGDRRSGPRLDGPGAPHLNPARVAASGVAAAALLGTVVATLAVFGVDVLRAGFLTGAPAGRVAAGAGAAGPDAAALLIGGTFGGFVIAAVTAWWLLGPIDSYRRAILALASSFRPVPPLLPPAPGPPGGG